MSGAFILLDSSMNMCVSSLDRSLPLIIIALDLKIVSIVELLSNKKEKVIK